MRAAENVSTSLPGDIEDLLHPGKQYARPADVLANAGLTIPERRAILSAWASDAYAVASAPPLRRAPFAIKAVTFDEIMDALRELDRIERPDNPEPQGTWRVKAAHRVATSRAF